MRLGQSFASSNIRQSQEEKMANAVSQNRLQQLRDHSAPGPTPPTVAGYLNSLYSLHGKTALVTGGTRGLGRQITISLASAGANLILLVRNDSDPNVNSLTSIVESLGRKIVAYTADLTDRSTYLPLVSCILQKSPIDIFIHSAGLQHREPAVDFSEQQWDKIIEVNLSASFLISRLIAKHWISLLPSPTSNFPTGSHKTIVLLGSSLSRGLGGVNIPAYASTKGGVGQLVKSLSNEWLQYGINVNALAPGYFATDLTRGITGQAEREMLSRVPLGRWGQGRKDEGNIERGLGDLEGMVVALCGRGAEFVSGETLLVDGGFAGR